MRATTRRPAALRLTVLLGLGLAFSLSVTVPDGRADDGRAAVNLTAFDQLGRPGEGINVRAKLSHDGLIGIHPNMHGYPLSFAGPTIAPRVIPTAEEGIAAVGTQAPANPGGMVRVQVRFPGSRGHRPAESVARLFSWSAESRILVVDIDHTISNMRSRDILFTDNDRIPTLPGAVESLTRLSGTYRILYLTARDESLYNKTRSWLEAKGFPEGPLFTRDFNLFREGQGEFKRRFLAELKTRFPNTVVGVGDREEDARAYVANGLRAFILAPVGAARVSTRAVLAPSWGSICDSLLPSAASLPDTVPPQLRQADDGARPARRRRRR